MKSVDITRIIYEKTNNFTIFRSRQIKFLIFVYGQCLYILFELIYAPCCKERVRVMSTKQLSIKHNETLHCLIL